MKHLDSISMVVLILAAMLMMALDLPIVKAVGTIYIRADGSIDPPTAPISSTDNITYVLTDNIFSDTDGIVIERTDNIILDGNGYVIQGSGGGTGILRAVSPNLHPLGDVTVKHSVIRDFSAGITIQNPFATSHVIIYRNNMTNGLSFYGCEHVDIIENNLADLSTYSDINQGTYLNVSQNRIDGGFLYWGSMFGGYFSVIGNNITGGIFSWGDETCGVISSNEIEGDIYLGGEGGFWSVLGNNVTGGIRLQGIPSGGGTISGNCVKGGIEVIDLCRPLSISRNFITTNFGGTGIYISMSWSDVTISKNDIYENEVGISITNLYNSIPCAFLVYHNNLMNNTRHVGANTDANDSHLVWDDGVEGNYWDNYTGIDMDHDGIGDTPHVIDANNTDNFPLMLPYKGHNIAVRDVTMNRTIVPQGSVQKVDVEVANAGSFPHTFSLTVYVNTTETQTLAVTLAAEDVITIRFYWDTSTLQCGNCAISAYAWPVPGETVTSDNNFTNGWILLTIPGDVDGDRDVDIFDIVAIAICYGATAGEPTYNVNYDIDGDGDIDIFDIVAVASHYGESW